MQGCSHRGLAEWLICACGVWLIGLGLYFIFFRPALLPEDIRYIGSELQVLQVVAPHLGAWLGKVFIVMGGFMTGTGVLIVYVSAVLLRARPRWATRMLLLVGSLTLVLMSAVNFALHSDFRWLLAIPAFTWLVALLPYAFPCRFGNTHATHAEITSQVSRHKTYPPPNR